MTPRSRLPAVALFTYSVRPRGSVVHAACLAEALQAEGADVTLYALAKSGESFFRPLACPLVLFPAAPAPADPDRLVAQRLAELHAGFRDAAGRHDVYHAEDCLTASALKSAPGARFEPVVRTVHHVERFQSPYLAECQRRSVAAATALVSVSAFTAREVREHFGRDSRIIHNGVNPRRFDAAETGLAGARLPEALGITGESVLLLSVGGVEARKNLDRALDAAIPVLAEEPRLTWAIAGGASIWDHSAAERAFDERVRALPVEVGRRVVRLGPVEEASLTALYRRADVLLAPSLHEGWGLAVLEAMAARTAVICSAREPFTEFLDPEVACLVDPESAGAIRAALRRVTADSRLRERLARAGERRARAFTWRRAARAHLELYQTLVRDARAPDRSRALPPV